jgi:hypothetical protein
MESPSVRAPASPSICRRPSTSTFYALARFGETTTNFRLPAPAAPRRALDVRLGRGGRLLRLLKANGSIRLHH